MIQQPEQQRQPKGSAGGSDPGRVAPNERVADFEAALRRFAGNRPLLLDMIHFFREDTPDLLADIEAGLASGEAQRVKRAAHSVKGLASNFDAHQVTSLAFQIEQMAEREEMGEIPTVVESLRQRIAELELAFAAYLSS